MLYTAALPDVNRFCASEYPCDEKPSSKHLALPSWLTQSTAAGRWGR